MGTMIKWALLLGGGFWLYETLMQPQTAGLPNSGVPAVLPPTNTTPATSTTATNSASLAAIRSQLQNLATAWLGANPGVPGLDTDQWSYFYAQLRGVPFPDWPNQAILNSLNIPLTAPGRNQVITVDQYLNSAAAAGLSGYRGGLGLAPVIRFSNRRRSVTLPLSTPAIAAIARASIARRGANYVRPGTPMVRGRA